MNSPLSSESSETANRVMVVAAVVFLFAIVIPFTAESIGIGTDFFGFKLYFGVVVGAAFVADRIYVGLTNKS